MRNEIIQKNASEKVELEQLVLKVYWQEKEIERLKRELEVESGKGLAKACNIAAEGGNATNIKITESTANTSLLHTQSHSGSTTDE